MNNQQPPKLLEEGISLTWKDFTAVFFIGEYVAWALFILLKVNAPELPVSVGVAETLGSTRLAIILAVVFPLLSVVALFLSYLVGKRIKVVFQAAKFFVVGALNTFLDFGVLNLLIFLTSIAAGPGFAIFKGISFILGVVNSYFWNKFWVFKNKNKQHVGGELAQFLGVSMVGLLINVGTATFMVEVVGQLGGIGPSAWANIAALTALVVSLLWNFIGYKVWVFKK